MEDKWGVYWVAVGKKAEESQRASLHELRSHMGMYGWDWGTNHETHEDRNNWNASQVSRWNKLQALSWPWEKILYIDADAFARTSLKVGFKILEDGFDMVICPSLRQSSDWCWHVGDEERLSMAHLRPSCAFQGGLFWVQNTVKMQLFFSVWQEEWLKFEGQDQGALLRAAQRTPLKIWLLSQERFVDHKYGAARNGRR